MKANPFFLALGITLMLFSCHSPEENDSQTPLDAPIDAMDETEGGMSFYLKKFNGGIDFYALGNEPFWSLDASPGKSIDFKTAEGFEMKIPYAPFREESGMLVLSSETEMGSMRIELHREDCDDNMSGTPFSHKVRVFIETADGGQSFEGCGRFVVNPALHDVYILKQWNGQNVDGSTIAKGAPLLEFNLANLKVSGHSGCNQISARIRPEPGILQFSLMASTMMACEGSMEFEQMYNAALGAGAMNYTLENSQMTLVNSGNKMIFQKVD